MKKIVVQILLVACVAASARANTPLTIGNITLIGLGGPCWDDTLLVESPPTASGSFSLNGVSGTGTVNSSAAFVADNVHGKQHVLYTYSLDMNSMSPAPNHCVKLLIHFGSPLGCAYDVLVLTNGTGSAGVSSAMLASFGDINFLFGSG